MSPYDWIRPLLFRLDPEQAHNMTLKMLGAAGEFPVIERVIRRSFCFDPHKPVHAFGLDFPNPLGLAAGYDKDGRAMRGLAALGFGHLELGTVTPLPQSGNRRPRVFRLTQDRALINRMGFPNSGAHSLLGQIQTHRPKGVILGVNIGKGMETSVADAAEDYLALLDAFYDEADYLAVNISSPNTPGLRELQERDRLEGLLSTLAARRRILVESGRGYVPILVKLAPDLLEAALDEACGAIGSSGMDGVIATNTTLSRHGLRDRKRIETGGLSGAPLRALASEVISKVHGLTDGKLPIVGAGGVFGPEDARAMFDAGASLVQVFTGLVYQGPWLPRRILEGLKPDGRD